MGEEITTVILTSSVVSSALTGVFSLINRKLDKKEKRTATESALIIGMQELLCDRIKERGAQYIKRGYIELEEYEDLQRMNAVYKDQLGGNGFVKKIMKEVDNLPIKSNKKGA